MYIGVFSIMNNLVNTILYKVPKYNYYFKYDSKTDTATYIISLDYDRKRKQVICLTFDNNFNLDNNFDFYRYDFKQILSSIAHDEMEEFKNNKEAMMSRFKDPSPFIQKCFSFKNLNQLSSFISCKRSLSDKIQDMIYNESEYLNFNSSYTSQKVELIPEFEFKDFSNVMKVLIGNEKKYVIKDNSDFIQSVDNNETVKFGKQLQIKLSEEAFTDRSLKLLQLMRNFKKETYCCRGYSENVIAKAISLFTGSILKIDNVSYKVEDEIIKANVNFNEDGKFVFSPSITNEYEYKFLEFNNTLVIINLDKRTIKLLEFENKAQILLFTYGIHLGDDINNVQESFDAQAKNFIKKAVHPKISNLEDSKFKINLYVSLDLQKAIHFKTTYTFEDQEFPKEHFSDNAFYSSIILDYEMRLQELNFLENGKTKDLEVLNTVLMADYSRIRNVANVFLSDEILNMRKKSVSKAKITASSSKDWLSVQVSADDYSDDELKQILTAYKKKKKFVLLKNNFVSLDNTDVLDSLLEVYDKLDLGDNMQSEELPFYHAFNLGALEKENFSIDFDDKIKQIITSIKNFNETELALNENISSSLRNYQIEAVKWMKTLNDNHLSGILADDMGLGKSLEFIAFKSLVKENAPSLIVCPKSLIYNWKSEFKKWDKSTKCHVIDGDKTTRLSILNDFKDTNDVFVTSYDSLRNDLDNFKEIHFAVVCLDEAQYIKNSFTLKSKAVKQLDSTSRFALTGTPIENSLTDLWSIFDFLMPHYLLSEKSFSEEYLSAFSSGSDEDTKNKLLAKITPFILRRSKNDVLTDLPPKTTEIVYIKMSEKQSQFYNAYVQNTRKTMNDEETNKLSILSALTRMRQICVDPQSFLENFDEISPKLEHTISLVQNGGKTGHKILIFSQFTTVLTRLKELLEKEGIHPLYIDGDTKAKERINIANKFNSDDKITAILVSLKAGGTGLNLYGADTVIHMDPWRNYAVEEQATDRAHRIGQTRPVTVYKLVAHDSIEEKVIELQEQKKDLYEQVIRNGSENITGLTNEDIEFLLS